MTNLQEVEAAQHLATQGARLELVTRRGTCPIDAFVANEALVCEMAGVGWKIDLVA